MPSPNVDAPDTSSQSRLLRSLAEELKLPLLQIARVSELARLGNNLEKLEQVETIATTAIKLLDSYVLSTQSMIGQQTLELEPVSLTATMYDTAQYLYRLAKLYDCKVDLNIKGKYGLVMAHPQGLQAALTSLGYSLISASQAQKPTKVTLTASSTRQQVIAGIYSNRTDVGKQLLEQAKRLTGLARQPIAGLTHNSGAGVMVAQSLFEAMASNLKIVRKNQMSGFAANLLPSQQLALL